MTKEQAIKSLQHLEDGEEIVLAWWQKSAFEGQIKDGEWPNLVAIADSKMDWSNAQEDILNTYESRE